MTETFRDDLVAFDATGLPDRYFDRFMFNCHATDSTEVSIIIGLGVYPTRDVVDGFAVLVTPTEQRNVRFSTEASDTDGASTGPLSWQVVEPNAVWHLVLGPNPTGLELDLTWRARTAPWVGDIAVANTADDVTSFEHLVQSGRYDGTLSIDGARREIRNWYGQRDRSRGVRTMSGGQGLHLWFQAQFPDRSIGFLLVEDRSGGRLLLEGAVMHEDGRLDDVAEVRHDLTFDTALDLGSGTVEVRTASGATYRVDADASAGGGYMAGAGYGGHHGRRRGRDHVEHDVYPLDGSVSPRTVDSALTDRLTTFVWDGTPGIGILEFAHSRSSSYSYRPSLTDS